MAGPWPVEDHAREAFRAPSRALLALELPRAAHELGLFYAIAPYLTRVAPRGDGHPVVVLPGFMADDNSTRVMRRFLRRLGYHVHAWRLGVNLGPTDRILDGMATRLAKLHDRHGARMSFVGWSLGGIYAREIARIEPESVRQVITLGSPFRLRDRDEDNVGPLYDMMATFHSARADARLPEDLRAPLPVPTTAIYSKSDGIAPWQSCREDDSPRAESIEVRGSHCGLGHHPGVLLVVADRLAQPEGRWAPFRPERRHRLLI